ncbi:hypothetical protein ZIOFF_041372 [Zingiber officinale]|uniref:Uncharacterized protein n=1 Tax=Zingiber officinale TaxID=94328 RepID=A0A8J5L597_ZINOF|nr:hypothetical protein ZIOFF_041372 [Zingiber officinale]
MIPEKSILDDDLDEAFLREVDAICEKRSTVKKERLGEEAVENKGCVVGGYKDLGSCRLRGLFGDADDESLKLHKKWKDIHNGLTRADTAQIGN